MPPTDRRLLKLSIFVTPLTSVKKVNGTISIFNRRMKTSPTGSSNVAFVPMSSPRAMPITMQIRICV
jgi:hypothetical protein